MSTLKNKRKSETALHKDAFWRVVARCLEEFFKFPKRVAYAKAFGLRRRIENRNKKLRIFDIIYHAHPYNLAYDLSNTTQDSEINKDFFDQDKYQEIEDLEIEKVEAILRRRRRKARHLTKK